MVEAVNVEATILIGKLAGARFDATGKNPLTDASNPQLVTLLHKLLELRRQMSNFFAKFLKLRTTNPPGENSKLSRLSVNVLRHVQRAQTLDREVAADFIGKAESGFGVIRYKSSRRFETESVGNL